MTKAEEKRRLKIERLEAKQREIFPSSPILASEAALIRSIGAPQGGEVIGSLPAGGRGQDPDGSAVIAPLVVSADVNHRGNGQDPPTILAGSEGGVEPEAADPAVGREDGAEAFGDVLPPGVSIPTDAVLFKELAKAIRDFEPRVDARRKAIAVSRDAFSRVSYLAYEERLDKLAVVSYLLEKHLPRDKSERLPTWLQQAPPGAPRVAYLAYLEDDESDRKLRWLRTRFRLGRVDVVERAVLKFLPASPYQLPSKQRHVGGYVAFRQR